LLRNAPQDEAEHRLNQDREDTMMELPLSENRRMKVDEFDSGKMLAKAAQQAKQRNYDQFPIVDVDSHHYELESFNEILEYMPDPVMKQLAQMANSGNSKGVGVMPGGVGYQDMGGRVTRYPLRRIEKPEPGVHRDVSLTRRWMDAMGVDIAVLFPSPMLQLGLHPQVEAEVALATAYNRWLAERVLAAEDRIRSMIYLPFNDPEASFRMVKEFAGKKGVCGFMVTSVRYKPIHHNSFMKVYSAIEETGLPLAFHAGYNWNEQSMTMMNKFIAVHALGFVWYNMVHLTNWVLNALPERFPKLKVIWIESGLAWLPFMIQRLDNEYMMRSSECPGLKKLPGEYITDMFYTSQPMEIPRDMSLLEATFKCIKAESQLLYSSDYPHWDFDLPSTIYDLPFLKEKAKRDILGGNAAKLFKIDTNGRKLAKVA
jgi:predicted TIM-barrel fold metal-dependent hydrolase